jgi:sarcosine oxidase subunit alpha
MARRGRNRPTSIDGGKAAMTRRIEGMVKRPAPVSFTVDGVAVEGFAGESLAAALLAAGLRKFRAAPRSGAPRGPFCMMGVCQECLVRVDGRPVAACLATVRTGIAVALGCGR